MSIVFWLAFLALPALAVVVDGVAGVRAHGIQYQFSTELVQGFRVLVPIWGDAKYLLNAGALHGYGPRVTLVTTGDETGEFYAELHAVAAAHGFKVWTDTPLGVARQQAKRATGGTTRDRIIRDVLPSVSEPYVVCLDADSVPGGDLALLVGELRRRDLDVASVRIVPSNATQSVLARLQYLEYWLAMQIRFIAPWMVSGACHAARTPVWRDVMSRHSLSMQGNDVEAGLIAESRGYKVGHIAFEIHTDVPARFYPWLRQRLAWAGGQWRLFIVNARFIRRHPFFWAYGGLIAVGGMALRWQVVTEPPTKAVVAAIAGYAALIVALYLKRGKGGMSIFLMPAYIFAMSFMIMPFGGLWYVKMSAAAHNWGVIRPNRPGARSVYLPRAERYARPPRPPQRPQIVGVKPARKTKLTTTMMSIVVVVVGLGAVVTGGYTQLPHLPTGIVSGGAAIVHGRNRLADGGFTHAGGLNMPPVTGEKPTPVAGLAYGWASEYSTATEAAYTLPGGGQHVTYAGKPGDTGPGHKLEIFQDFPGGVHPGQTWRFQVTISGAVMFKAYVLVGVEWFRHPGERYIAERDVYPKVISKPQQVAVTTPPLPANASALAAYIQFPEISPGTLIDDVAVSGASLVLSP